MKRRYAELSKTSSNNDALIRLLRETPNDEARGILERIRSDESIQSILGGADERSGDGPATNLMLAIEGANAPRSDETSSSEPSDPQSQQPSTPAEPPLGSIDKQSIAFLVGETRAAQAEDSSSRGASSATSPGSSVQERGQLTRTVPEPHSEGETYSPAGAAHQQPTASHPSPSRSDQSAEKRTRFFEPTRPGLQARHSLSTPATFRPKPGSSSLDTLATKARSNDTSWKRRLAGVKATDWDVDYADDNAMLEIIKCYFVWENPTLGFVDEEAFWEGLLAGGSDFCNKALVHAIVAFGAVSLLYLHARRVHTQLTLVRRS